MVGGLPGRDDLQGELAPGLGLVHRSVSLGGAPAAVWEARGLRQLLGHRGGSVLREALVLECQRCAGRTATAPAWG